MKNQSYLLKKMSGSIPDASSVSFHFQLCQWRQDFLYRCMEYNLRYQQGGIALTYKSKKYL